MRLTSFVAVLALCCVPQFTASAQNQSQNQNQSHELNAQGVVYYNAGNFPQAQQSFKRALQDDPNNRVIRRNLCNACQAEANELAKVADFAGAAKLLETAIGSDPENASPLVQLGSYYLRLDMVAEAIQRLEHAIELAPYNEDAHELLGDAYYMDNDTASARVQWEWVLEVKPNRPGLKAKLEKAMREEAVESNFRPAGSRHFQLTSSPDIPGRALRTVLSILEQAYVNIGRNFGGAQPTGPIQVIVYNAQGFSEATQQGAHVGALYDGKIRIPLTDPEGNLLTDQDLHDRLWHEYTHVVVRYLGGKNVPWWLNEGLAEAFSRQLSAGQQALLQKAAEDGALFSLSALEGNQLDQLPPDELRLAYAQAHITVDYLWTSYGQARLAQLMSNLAEGIEIKEALHQNYRRSYESLQKEVNRRITPAETRVIKN
jgi:Tfp pilus assembly protein PilF